MAKKNNVILGSARMAHCPRGSWGAGSNPGGATSIFFFSFWSFFFHRLFTLLLVSVYSQCWRFFASRDFCDNVLLVLVWLQHCPWIAIISTTLTKKTFPSRRWTIRKVRTAKKHCNYDKREQLITNVDSVPTHRSSSDFLFMSEETQGGWFNKLCGILNSLLCPVRIHLK